MRKYRKAQKIALLLAGILAIDSFGGLASHPMESYAYTERTATVNATTLNVRSGPGTTYSLVGKLGTGASVTVTDETTAADGALWYQIRFTGANGAQTSGYVLKNYIKFPVAYTNDGNFEAQLSSEGFPESYKSRLRELHAQYPSWVFRAQHTNLDWNTAVKEESQVGRSLVHRNSVSSWKSIENGAFNWDTSSWTGFDGSAWVAASEDIVRYYMDPRNFLDETNIFQFLSHSYDSNSHTVEGLKTMVKGTFLEGYAPGSSNGEPGGGSDPSGGTAGGGDTGTGGSLAGPGAGGPGVAADSPVETSAQGNSGSDALGTAPSGSGDASVSLEGPHASVTPKLPQVLMEIGPGVGIGPGAGLDSGNSGPSSSPSAGVSVGSKPYVDIILNAGTQSGVNPYVLAAMIIQEQGSNGGGRSISGTEAGYSGIYNFFNVESYQSGNMEPVERGLWWASQSGSYERPWNTPERSILGGAMFYGNNYVKVGQDTFYLKKFNVQGTNLYKHQYMTNVQGAASEGQVYAKAYNDEMKQTALEFKIPVYRNMPDNASGKPVIDGSPNNKLSALGVDGFIMTPTFNRDTTEYNLIVDPSVSNVNILASALDSTAQIGGTGAIQLQNGNNDIRIAVTAQNGSIRTYVIHVVRQENGPTYSPSVGGVTGGNSPVGGTNQTGDSGSSGGPGVNIGPGGAGTSTGSAQTGVSTGGTGTSTGGQTLGGNQVIIAPDGSGGAPSQTQSGDLPVMQAPGA